MKKSMKKKRRGIAACLALALLIPVVASGLDVSAARRSKYTMDSFDDAISVGAIDSGTWTGYTNSGNTPKIQEIVAPENVLEFQGTGVTGESAVLMSNDWYWNVKSITFDVKVPDSEQWFGVDFADIQKPTDYVGDYADNGEPMCYGALRISKTGFLGIKDADWTYWGFANKEIPDTWVSVKIVSNGAKSGKIYMAPKGKSFDESKAKEITLGTGRSFQNSNIVFVDYRYSGYKLDNVVINADNKTLKDDFEETKSTLFKGVTYLKNSSSFSFPIAEDGAVRKLAFADSQAGDRLIANVPIKKQDEHLKDTDEVMSATFTTDFNGNNASAEIAYVFALSDNTADPFVDSWAYIMNRSGGRIVKFETDGTETVGKKCSHSGNGSEITLSLTKDGTFRVLENGNEVMKYKGVTQYEGYVGFTAKTNLPKTVYIDDVVISNTVFEVVTTKTVSDDFSTDKLGVAGQTDFAYRATTGTIQVKNGELVFEQCADGTRYGSAYEYETFEMEFKLTSIKATDDPDLQRDATGPGRWIGIDFGRQDVAATGLGTYGALYMRVTPSQGTPAADWETTSVALYKNAVSTMKGEELVNVKPIPASYFTDITYDGETKQREDISANAAVCFKVVATDNSVELYLKRADQKNYTLYATLKNVYPPGFATITCTAWSYFTIDDFEIRNTATVFNEPKEEEVVTTMAEKLDYAERGVGVKNTWDDEQKLNVASDSNLLVPVIIIGASVVLLVAVIIVVVYMNKKKKNKMPNEKVKEEKNDEKI